MYSLDLGIFFIGPNSDFLQVQLGSVAGTPNCYQHGVIVIALTVRKGYLSGQKYALAVSPSVEVRSPILVKGRNFVL